jgi:hypothetical protein
MLETPKCGLIGTLKAKPPPRPVFTICLNRIGLITPPVLLRIIGVLLFWVASGVSSARIGSA